MNSYTPILPVILFTELLLPMCNLEAPLPARQQCARILRIIVQFCCSASQNRGERAIFNRLYTLTLNLDQLEYYTTETLTALYQEIHLPGHTAHFIVFMDNVAQALEHSSGNYLNYSCLFQR